jgi:Rieske Fe-S protein
LNTSEGNGLPRRRFLKLGAGSVGAIIGLSYVGVIGDFLNPPAASAEPLQKVGTVDEFAVGTPKLVTYQGNGIEEGLYVTNFGQGEWLALDFHCTHLQCAVNWIQSTQQYACPCHGGVYDIRGNVISGPPPRALRKRRIKVEGDSVQIGGIIS